jgi:hypothetical protein
MPLRDSPNRLYVQEGRIGDPSMPSRRTIAFASEPGSTPQSLRRQPRALVNARRFCVQRLFGLDAAILL